MAFSYTKDSENVSGDLRWTSGTFTSTSVETGEIYTGLQQVQGMILQQKADAVVASQPAIDETFPMHDPVTIITASNAAGYWSAWGY